MADVLIIAEKPSVARDIARVVGASSSFPGFLRGNGYTVSWAMGHMVALPEPQEISPEWKVWRVSALPMIPEAWPLKVIERTREQYSVLKRLLTECADIICATDAGREGELIFRYLYEATKCRKSVRRLWISSLTPEAIRDGLNSLKDAAQYDPLAYAARARSQADWLVGMNLSRAYALTYNDRFFVGRVQTPTLALVVERDREIKNFKPEDYIELEATFGFNCEKYLALYLGETGELKESGPRPPVKRFPPDGVLAKEISERVKSNPARVKSVEAKRVSEAPPQLYDLTELQRHANRLFGFSASHTLEIAQALYEQHKLITYPRTGSAHLSQAVAKDLKSVVDVIAPAYREPLHPETGVKPLGARYVDDAKVTDHHAIIPTPVNAANLRLKEDERKIYDLVCRRLLQLWQGDYVTGVTTLLTQAGEDVFRSLGTQVQEIGWKQLEISSIKSESKVLPSGLKKDSAVETGEVKPLKKTTRPPPHLTDASLLAGMESAGRNLDDRELKRVLLDLGLGTPATRAGIIETLLARGYLARDGKTLRATELGTRLVDTVHPSVKSPELTARWEQELARIQKGERKFEDFMRALTEEIKARVKEVVTTKNVPPPPSAPLPSPVRPTVARTAVPEKSTRTGSLGEILESTFGFSQFRPHQEKVCRAVADGKDVLLVMPTGAGKSLCYQLPGLVRGGTTLVISPLVALIEDQVDKLKKMGIAAERIHSGRAREESRNVCHLYLDGKLDFLFIAPERLGVRGFPEMLQRRPLSLIAVDEAHCISHWGHDFRPDYRLLGERLGGFRPAPVIALTATATPLVQDDIVKQLGLKKSLLSIHGFRRTNIAIQLVELSSGERTGAIAKILESEQRRPAIIYAPTRKAAEKITEDLGSRFRVDTYHAGLPADARDRVQESFLRSDLDVIVATVAFGMGIDKADVRTVIHAALPGSLEGYYQEIGRAGRDGKPSRAILFHAYPDRKTHEFFFEKSYPKIGLLKQIYRELGERPIQRVDLAQALRSMDDETFHEALEKLWIHKGCFIDPDDNVTRGSDDWEEPYNEQREYRADQLQRMIRYADSNECRMVYLIRHFGDTNDGEKDCGKCDVCDPDSAEHRSASHVATLDEQRLAAKILAALSARPGYPAGRLFEDMQVVGPKFDRREFESLLTSLIRQRWVRAIEDTFEKDRKVISFRRLSVTDEGETKSGEDLAHLRLADVPVGAKSKKKGKGKKQKTESAPKSSIKTPEAQALFEKVKGWRTAEARKKGVPAFCVLTDAVIERICEHVPQSEDELLSIKGMGPALVKRYGTKLIQMVREN